ncbi:MAG: dolichyl-phosphate-mannose-protein mannosyltransferase [Actinomycetota bacterium]|nr:dolichyl-phosphate-mannose-protein mannosyltransferase [Actinomycetota bacterium]
MVAVTYTDVPPTPALPSAAALRDRLMPPFPGSRLWGWLAPIAIMLFAGYLRFNRLSIPGGTGPTRDYICKPGGKVGACVFDEVYYTHDAYSLYHHGVELNAQDNGPGFIVHPPLGKWMIALGEWIVRDPNFTNTFGWRFMSAVVGTLAVLIVARTARRMTRSTLLGCVAGLLMCLDGLEFVQSRTSMLDIFLMFWVVVAFACLILDRDQVRARLADRAASTTYGENGPRIGMRWWLLACGVSVGAACATKWDGLYLIPAFGLLAGFWTMGAKRAIGVRKPLVSTLLRDVAPIVGWMLLVPIVVYLVSWTGWFLNGPKYAYDRNWAVGRHTDWGFIPASLRSLWHYHWEAYNFHVHLSSYHTYRENAWGWLFDARPVLYYAGYPHPPALGCNTYGLGCARMIYNLGTPAIWWVSIPVMCFMLYLVFKRDWRGGAVLVPFLILYVPWLFQFKRTMFFFYALPLLPFICIALAVTIGYLLGPADASPNRRMIGTMIGGAYLLIVVVAFFYWLPIMSARTIPFVDGWQQRMGWFQSWIEDKGS